jgi:hypothetical protein
VSLLPNAGAAGHRPMLKFVENLQVLTEEEREAIVGGLADWL